jgi:hypothetical protein
MAAIVPDRGDEAEKRAGIVRIDGIHPGADQRVRRVGGARRGPGGGGRVGERSGSGRRGARLFEDPLPRGVVAPGGEDVAIGLLVADCAPEVDAGEGARGVDGVDFLAGELHLRLGRLLAFREAPGNGILEPGVLCLPVDRLRVEHAHATRRHAGGQAPRDHRRANQREGRLGQGDELADPGVGLADLGGAERAKGGVAQGGEVHPLQGGEEAGATHVDGVCSVIEIDGVEQTIRGVGRGHDIGGRRIFHAIHVVCVTMKVHGPT